jgi:hypothetical protein
VQTDITGCGVNTGVINMRRGLWILASSSSYLSTLKLIPLVMQRKGKFKKYLFGVVSCGITLWKSVLTFVNKCAQSDVSNVRGWVKFGYLAVLMREVS